MDYKRIQIYCLKNGIVLTENDFYDGPVRIMTDRQGTRLDKWDLPIKRPTLDDLKDIGNEEIQRITKINKLKQLQDNELLPVLQNLCKKLNIDIQEII